MQPLKILQEAIKAVPAMRYALGVAGMVAVVALVAAFKLDPKVAVFGAIITLGLMVGLVIFARLTKIAPTHFLRPVLVMMWSFLVLIIAQATLLFSAVSFRQPKALADWLFPIVLTNGPTSQLQSTDTEVAPEILEAARRQSDAGDYAGAWKQIEDGLKSAPNSQAGLQLQASIAMAWLRNISVIRGEQTFSEIVDLISPCLYRAAHSSNKIWAADAHAHIGWGNHLKAQEGPELDIEGPFKRAVALDANNTFAHAMWGFSLLWNHRPYHEARAHFEAALQSGREKNYVRELQLAALVSQRSSEYKFPLICLLNAMRKAGETIDAGQRDRILALTYWFEWKEVLDNINGATPALPASEHLATLKWLSEGIEKRYPYRDFFIARLTEQTGDRPTALALYRAMASVENPGIAYSDLEKDIQEGISRCSD